MEAIVKNKFDGRSWKIACFGAFLLTSACSASDGTGGPGIDADATSSLEQGLHANGGNIPWHGAAMSSPETTAQPGGLTVIWQVQIGLSNGHPTGIQASWYKPSNPDNQFRLGDPMGFTLVGKDTASSWPVQRCPDFFVVYGYQYKLNSAGNRIDSLGVLCRSLTAASSTVSMPMLGSSPTLFTSFGTCNFPDTTDPGYVESIAMNAAGNGIGAKCVLP